MPALLSNFPFLSLLLFVYETILTLLTPHSLVLLSSSGQTLSRPLPDERSDCINATHLRFPSLDNFIYCLFLLPHNSYPFFSFSFHSIFSLSFLSFSSFSFLSLSSHSFLIFFLSLSSLSFLSLSSFFIAFFFLFCTFSTYKLQIFILTLKHFLILCLLFFSLFFSFSSSFKHYSFLLAFFLTYPSQTSFLSLSLHFLSVFPFSFPPGLTLSSFTFFFLFPSRSSPSHQFPSFSLSFSFSPS
ncbi:unnamed protein product [Acanthosepion pharaonis]|uniref:Uncharacterized protein n=1 Tax=Acanthosepion pharaonis TaxID=158019 RepID=A0A812BQL5_ACAPH|nr:unnamed protein product [Sepia pharaonis]